MAGTNLTQWSTSFNRASDWYFLVLYVFFYLIYDPESLLYVSLAEAETEEPPAKEPLKERDPNQENLENKCKAEERAEGGN